MITPADEVVAWSGASMGGRVEVAVATTSAERKAATRAAALVGGRVSAWASRLTRFSDSSDLALLNGDGHAATPVRPTLAAVLCWSEVANDRSEGVVDVTLLGARLAAESGTGSHDRVPTLRAGHLEAEIRRPWNVAAERRRTWRLEPDGRRTIVHRPAGLRFDLDGVAKGWIADRASELLRRWPGAVVDADGDVALHARAEVEWLVAVADPRSKGAPPLATLRITGGPAWRRSVGVATSGISVHRWRDNDGHETHHLIDPRTGRPAVTDVVQATVVASSASEAEVLAKAALILGSARGAALLGRSAARAAILLLTSGEIVALPGTEAWLA